MKCSKDPKLPQESKQEKESPGDEAEKFPFYPSTGELFGVLPEGHRSSERLNKKINAAALRPCRSSETMAPTSTAPSALVCQKEIPEETLAWANGLCPTSAFVLFLRVSQRRQSTRSSSTAAGWRARGQTWQKNELPPLRKMVQHLWLDRIPLW